TLHASLFTFCCHSHLFSFLFNDTATTESYTLSLHDALPIYPPPGSSVGHASPASGGGGEWLSRPAGPSRPAGGAPGRPCPSASACSACRRGWRACSAGRTSSWR